MKMETQNIKLRDAAISARVPVPLKTLIQKYVALDTHINESDFVRDAIREKIQKDAPHLYRNLFKEETWNE